MLADTNTWPPEDPTAIDDSNRKDEFTLPSTPWTYSNGSLNPNLQPSNTYMRSVTAVKRRKSGKRRRDPVPPYHPDYWSPKEDGDVSVSSHECSDDSNGYGSEKGTDGNARVRRGSEGYEVRPVDREEMLRRHVQEQGLQPSRYQWYVPQSENERDGEPDSEDAEDDHLHQHIG